MICRRVVLAKSALVGATFCFACFVPSVLLVWRVGLWIDGVVPVGMPVVGLENTGGGEGSRTPEALTLLDRMREAPGTGKTCLAIIVLLCEAVLALRYLLIVGLVLTPVAHPESLASF